MKANAEVDAKADLEAEVDAEADQSCSPKADGTPMCPGTKTTAVAASEDKHNAAI